MTATTPTLELVTPDVAPRHQAGPVGKGLAGARSVAASVGWAAVGIGVLVGAWALVSMRVEALPSPATTWSTLTKLVSNPFYDNGPNDKGIGLQLLSSLQRVGTGFFFAAIVGVPLGLAMGSIKQVWKAANPVIQLLRPVSPLAWFPIWLVVLKDAPKAGTWVIFITALWPIIINTASGAATVPHDQRSVAQVFKFSRLTYIRHVLVPHTLPSIVTGMRLSMGVAWMVIVAVEMLSGGVGIGFFVWNSYNALDLSKVIAAIVLIGSIGVALDFLFMRLGRLVDLEESVR